MNIELIRDKFDPNFTLGELFIDGKHFGFTCEDCDRHLEDKDEKSKVFGETAISRGKYRVQVSYSNRFQKELPIFLDVPYFDGIRIHGGNTAADSHGCLLLGRDRGDTGVSHCSERVATITKLIEEAEDRGEEVWITIS